MLSPCHTSSSYRDAQSWEDGDLVMRPEQLVTAMTVLPQAQPHSDSAAGLL